VRIVHTQPAGRLADKTHLNIGAAECVTNQLFTPLQRCIDIAKVVLQLAADARRQWRARLARPPDR